MTVLVPAVAVPGEIVNVELPGDGPAATLPGLRDALEPAGFPATESATVPLNPLEGVIVSTVLAELPCELLSVAGFAEMLKSAEGAGAPTGLKATMADSP